MLLEDVLKEFLFDCKMRKLSERTLKSYRNNNQRGKSFTKTLMKGNELKNSRIVTLLLRRKKEYEKFNEILIGDNSTLKKHYEDIKE